MNEFIVEYWYVLHMVNNINFTKPKLKEYIMSKLNLTIDIFMCNLNAKSALLKEIIYWRGEIIVIEQVIINKILRILSINSGSLYLLSIKRIIISI